MAATRPAPSARSKRRRRRRRAISLSVYVVIVFVLAWYFESQATTTIILVRHADTEVAAAGESDPPLSAAGRARAQMLADFVEDIDVLAGLDAVYASEFKRTQQTAEPVAKRLDRELRVTDQTDIVGFMSDVLDEHKGQIVLVVTHSDLLGQLVAELHGHQSVPEIAADEYDNFYIVTIPWYGKVKTLRLRYGPRWSPPATHSSG